MMFPELGSKVLSKSLFYHYPQIIVDKSVNMAANLAEKAKNHLVFNLPVRILRKIFRFSSPFMTMPIAYLIGMFCDYKIGIIHADRLGHLAMNTDLFFRRYQLRYIDSNINYILIAPSINSQKVANSQLLKMFKRHANLTDKVAMICNSIMYSFIKNSEASLFRYGKLHKLIYKSNEEEFSISSQSLFFTEEENEYGETQLKKIGIDVDSDKIVCVYARDDAYLRTMDGTVNWGYHDYRNADINTYIKSIQYLISNGYKVVRIGSIVNKPVAYSDSNFIDYSLSGYRSEFLDLFLVSKSRFIIGSTSGATDIAEVFKVPFLAVNFAPCIGSPIGKDDLYISKKYVNSKGDIIPYKDVLNIDREYHYNGKLLKEKYDIAYLDNTDEEILEAVIEMDARICGSYVETYEEQILMKKYFDKFWSRNKSGCVKTRICYKWLSKNKDLYFD